MFTLQSNQSYSFRACNIKKKNNNNSEKRARRKSISVSCCKSRAINLSRERSVSERGPSVSLPNDPNCISKRATWNYLCNGIRHTYPENTFLTGTARTFRLPSFFFIISLGLKLPSWSSPSCVLRFQKNHKVSRGITSHSPKAPTPRTDAILRFFRFPHVYIYCIYIYGLRGLITETWRLRCKLRPSVLAQCDICC